jgi:uncharacterized protein YwqG
MRAIMNHIDELLQEINEWMIDREEPPEVYWKQIHLEDIVPLKKYNYPEQIIKHFVSDHNRWLLEWVIRHNLHPHFTVMK